MQSMHVPHSIAMLRDPQERMEPNKKDDDTQGSKKGPFYDRRPEKLTNEPVQIVHGYLREVAGQLRSKYLGIEHPSYVSMRYQNIRVKRQVAQCYI